MKSGERERGSGRVEGSRENWRKARKMKRGSEGRWKEGQNRAMEEGRKEQKGVREEDRKRVRMWQQA